MTVVPLSGATDAIYAQGPESIGTTTYSYSFGTALVRPQNIIHLLIFHSALIRGLTNVPPARNGVHKQMEQSHA